MFPFRRRKRSDADEVPEYWITYSDLMVSLLMAFALLLFIAMGSLQAQLQEARSRIQANQGAIRTAAERIRDSGHSIALDSATGTLTMSSEVLFDYNSAELLPGAKAVVEQIATKFLPDLIRDVAVDTLIAEIAVEGHTDTVGSYISNLRLSQDRAYSVMRAMVEATYGVPRADRIRELIVASGKSEVRPIFLGDSLADSKSRRIEIHVRFRDDALLKSVLDAGFFRR